ncbi:MAG: replication-relaxation family protein [Acidimicrobiales bacterium]
MSFQTAWRFWSDFASFAAAGGRRAGDEPGAPLDSSWSSDSSCSLVPSRAQTEQICGVCFDNVNTAQHRLTKLYGLRLVDRFQPLHAGCRTGPYHYLLDEAGAFVLAVERGDDIENARSRSGRALELTDVGGCSRA